MKFKYGENVLLALLLLFLDLIKRSCPFNIEIVDPLVIKINTEKLEIIPIIVLLNQAIDNRAEQKIKLIKITNSTSSPFNKIIYAIEEEKQDKNNKKKIEFKFNQEDFKGEYGKYILTYGDRFSNFFNQTIFIYANDIILKNPKNKYFLTGQGIIEAKYDISSIFKDEINLIRYYEVKSPNTLYNLSKENYEIEGNDNNMKLVVKFSKNDSYSSYIFDIFPEYDKTASNSGIQRFYLYFQDYLLNNDAIYINRNNNTNEVPFNLTFRYTFNSNFLSIRQYSFRSNHLYDNVYEITINLGRKDSPGKVFITYNGQERELFYILYDFSFKRCYDKDEMVQLEITMEWINEMEYDHMLYFNDTTSKLLSYSYIGTTDTTTIYKYKYSTLSLNSGLFSLQSTIAALNYSLFYNPVDSNHIYFYILPNSQTFDNKTSYIYTNNNTAQYIYISSTEDDAITVLDEIILRKVDNKTEILVSKTNHDCNNNNTHFYCNLENIIVNYDDDKIIGNYLIIYKSKCGKNLTMDDKLVIIRKGIGLSDISPKWINKSIVKGSELILTYDGDLTNRKFKICFTTENKDESQCKYNVDNYILNKEKVTVFLDDMDEARYYVKTIISEDQIDFVQKDKSFKVSDPKIEFKFNHHYFVKNDNPDNKLIITVEEKVENEKQFGCIIVDNIENKTLNKSSDDCTIFEYNIDKTGTFKFNYFDKDNFMIPINDSIVVVSTYPQLFAYNEQFCFYYLFNISIDIMNSHKNKLKIKVFLKNDDNSKISLVNIENSENKYTYKNISYFNIIDIEGFYLYISEEIEDEKIYLYKSKVKVKFTEIETPEFIIDPNKTIVFSNVNCDLNSSIFKIIRMGESDVQNSLTYWKYDSVNKYLYYNITGDFYKANRFRYYYYQIDYKNINNISNENELYQTFASKRLNETNFELKKADTNDYVTIINKEKDFFFPLISGLNTFQEYRNIKNKTSIRNELYINNDNSTIKFEYKLAINDVLKINFLERTVYEWEERQNLGNSMYYFFNKDNIINGSSLDISPKLFAFNIPKQEDYLITILYSEAKQKNYSKTNVTNCTNEDNDIKEQECLIDYELKINTAQRIIINISDNINNFYEYIDFVYYHLDEKSTQCQTMDKNMNNITLLVDINNPNLKNKINLTSPDTNIIGEKREDNRISFILDGNNINLQRTYLQLFTDDGELDHLFTLQELGIDILPKYKMIFNNNKNVTFLLPEDNQAVKVIISVENNENIHLDDISGFKIKGENNQSREYKVGNETINGEPYSLNLIFNLSSVDKSEQNYLLYYTDRCGKDFKIDLKVSLVSFNFERKYFVLNNNKNSENQILKIKGPIDDKITLVIYKNGEYNGEVSNDNSNYYFYFSHSSQGDYTFRVINDGIESSINETVYVRENLGDILSLKNNISNCMFSNENKSAIKDFSYTISPSNINTNFTNFQSYFTKDQNIFENLTSSGNGNGNDKTFSIIYSNEMKNSININNKLYIYLTENNDKDQPIYVFNYSYTTIKLHSDFTKFIYTDADYIQFEMNCKINNMEKFELSNIRGNTYPIICEDRGTNDIFNEFNKIFKCYLSSDKNNNQLLGFGKDYFEYDNFNIKYSGVQITNEPIFLSQDIYSAVFKIDPPTQIGRNVTINIKVTTPRTYFYFPEVDKVTYYTSKEVNKENNTDLKYNSDDISFDLYVENHVNYYINKICRKHCSYCKENNELIKEIDCQLLNYTINSNTPEIYFKFDKHYIALENSTYRNVNDTNSILTIECYGDSKDNIQRLRYYRYITPTNIVGPTNIDRTNVINDKNYYELTLSKGKYTFDYYYQNIAYNISDIVLVTTYDYEMFDYSDFSNKCIFYDKDLTISGILVSINPNPNYDFKNDIIPAYLLLELNDKEFPFNGEKGYKISDVDRSFFDENLHYVNRIYFRETNLPTKSFIFTTFEDIYINTIFLSNNYYYKDNIQFNQQYCESNNIYIKSISNPGESFSLLKCDYENKTQYCDADDYRFSYRTNDYFYLYFGNKQLNSSFVINIYNSIKDSDFSLYYENPTIRIDSLNFDMDKISQFNIDNESITNNDFNKLQGLNSITYNYEIENGTEKYLTELRRKDHPLDRSTTIKIKKVNLKIVKSKCPDFTIPVAGIDGNWCITCAQQALAPGGDPLRIWYENEKCVYQCDNVKYFIYDEINHYCLDCIEKTNITGIVKCGCLEGTVKSPLDGVCYLPEDPEIKKAILSRPNTQCYRIDGTTHNYCKDNTTTSKCEVISISGADFPVCHCNGGYTGKYCEKKNNSINLNDNIDFILNNTDKINEGDPRVISKIRGITYFIEKDNSETNNINTNKINLFLEASIKCLNDALNEQHKHPQIYDVIELSVHFLIYKIKNFRRLRLLQEENKQDQNNLNFILENTHYLNYLANKNNTDSNYNIQSDGLNLISFISYRADAIDDSFRTYIKNMTYNNSIIGYTNLKNNKVSNANEKTIAVLTIINRKLYDLNSSENGLIFNFSISNNNIDLADLKDFYAYIYSKNIDVDYELANYYQAKNVNIYDKYDPCFKDACFTSENFEFDLTQQYRKKYVFQKWSLESEICRYHSFESASNNIELSCQKFEDCGKMNSSYNYATLNLTVKKDYVDNQEKVYNLPMRCKKKMKSENYAFWIFLIICILEIIYIIGITILTLGSLRRVSIRKGLRNDGLFYIIPIKPEIKSTTDDNTSNNDNPLKNKNDDYHSSVNEDYHKSGNEVLEKPIGIYNKTLFEGILSNFKELHPLSVLCRVSVISPLIMNSWFLVYNILCLFGFNALIYYEGLIEKRIYDKKRNLFDYPMRKEFHKIILSILLQIAFTVIIKFIVLVWPKQYEDLESKLRNCKRKGDEINNDIVVRYDDFQNEMFIRRLIGGSLMTIIIIFFFYYSVVFCEVYVNTQRNLVFSWVWSLFWEWVVFGPIYIVVISILENKKSNSKDPLVYYLKRLFFF